MSDALKTYTVVGWYAVDPSDATVAPKALSVEVEAHSRSEAFDKGDLALNVLRGRNELLNWYVKEAE